MNRVPPGKLQTDAEDRHFPRRVELGIEAARRQSCRFCSCAPAPLAGAGEMRCGDLRRFRPACAPRCASHASDSRTARQRGRRHGGDLAGALGTNSGRCSHPGQHPAGPNEVGTTREQTPPHHLLDDLEIAKRSLSAKILLPEFRQRCVDPAVTATLSCGNTYGAHAHGCVQHGLQIRHGRGCRRDVLMAQDVLWAFNCLCHHSADPMRLEARGCED
jgi:hypothetical protein